ncbi:transcriptional corepressor LEUNIG isoform X1 [Daucus carota subsp. sativus]|uniref:transcriptional corepressor LEUNIG isoform X1 n=1 Tax=Daucus carota subsp. sativus TaxID=79200 RepID=UPI0007EF31EF|nr:PREDICTED: transcriptional corepressor LEUNIG-like isoform X1 [Daucus carota subsp. sativus]
MDDPERILDAYIHDYLVKRRYSATSRIFQAEAAVPCNSTVIDAPGGFLYEWWSVFWDIFIARYKLQVPGVLSNSETQVTHEQENPQQRHQHSLESRRNLQMNEYLLQGKIQQQHQQLLGQQRRKEIEMDHRAHDLCSRQPDIMAIDANKALTMNSLAGQSRNIRNSPSAGISYLHPSINEGVTNTPLEGHPLNVRDHFQHRLQQQQQLNSLLRFPQAMNQYQPLENYILQAQQKSLLPTGSLETRQLGMVLNEQVTGSSNDGKLFSASEVVPNEGSGLQEGYPLSASGDGDVLTKQTQHNNEHRQQSRQGAIRKKSQNSDCTLYRNDKEGFGGSSTMFDDSLSNSSQRNDQASKNKTGQKRKISSSAHARKAVTTSTAGPSPTALPASSSSHRAVDSPRFSRSSCLLGNYGGGKHASGALSTPLDCFAGGQSLEVNDNTNMISNSADHQVDPGEGGSTFSEIGQISAACQVNFCNLSTDGKLLVTGGGYDKKANLWSTDLGELRGVFEEHSDEISDACFSPQRPCIATSSLDKTVKVWDVEKPSYSLQTFCGHSAPVTSIDYHPINGDLICSCDSVNEIRYWSVKNGECDRVLKGGGTKVRFQPNHGRYIASVGSGLSLLDVETTQVVSNQFEVIQGHALNIQSVCWDFSGEFLASISEDRIRVWKIGSGAQPDCIHELSFSGKQFHCCVFHPHYRALLVVGCSQSLDLWNMVENRLMTPVVEPVCALAVSETSGLVASASWDNGVKMWKWI